MNLLWKQDFSHVKIYDGKETKIQILKIEFSNNGPIGI